VQFSEQGSAGRGQTTWQVQEPVLIYDQQTGHWRGANEQFSIWMDDATFRAYVASWYDWPAWLPDRTPAERHALAVTHCQRVRYWFGSERNYDRRVHLTYH
jgi:hypothetical protein